MALKHILTIAGIALAAVGAKKLLEGESEEEKAEREREAKREAEREARQAQRETRAHEYRMKRAERRDQVIDSLFDNPKFVIWFRTGLSTIGIIAASAFIAYMKL